MSKIIPPNFKGNSFSCPHCGAFSQMNWRKLHFLDYAGANLYDHRIPYETPFWHVICLACKQVNIWLEQSNYLEEIDENHITGNMIYPIINFSPAPHIDMPFDVKQDYLEAANIRQTSPRGAAALLRLALQKLCKYLGETGEHINTDIRSLAKKGKVSQEVIHMADVLRITGNCSAHPGEMSDDDIDEVSDGLFELINFIIKEAISDPNTRSAIYNKMPENLRKKAEEQDAKNREKP